MSTTQISVRLPEEMVVFLDTLVAEGRVRSRASAIERALDREIRRHVTERDIELLKAAPDSDDELDGLAAWAARQPSDLG